MTLPTTAEYLFSARVGRAEGDADRCLFNAVVATSLARHEARDEDAYHAFACIGRMHISRLEHIEATGWYHLALDTALMHELKAWVAPAHHDLFLCYRERGDIHNADKHLKAAFEGYARSPRLDNLLADLSERDEPRERINRIAPLLHPGYDPTPTDRDRLILLAQISTAYGALGWVDKLHSTFRLMDTLLSREREAGALSLCTLARSALEARCFPLATDAARRARELAELREEMLVSALAQETMQQAHEEDQRPVPLQEFSQ